MPIRVSSIQGPAQAVSLGTADAAEVTLILEWESPRTCWLRGSKQKLSRAGTRELLLFLVSLGVFTLKIEPGEAALLPVTYTDLLGVRHSDITELSHRFASRGASRWADDPTQEAP